VAMKELFLDTRSDVEQFHIELIRKIPISRRLQMVTSLIQTTRWLSWLGICERYPHDTAEERHQRFFSLLYGDENLGKRVADLLVRRGIL